MTTKAGQLITDGNAVWIIDDVRDGARVGDIILRPTLRDGYVKANGATVKASEYPRLLAWVQESNMTVTAEQYAQDCSKYVYDAGADTFVLPNVTGRVLQGGETVKSVEAGLPNIVGESDDIKGGFFEQSKHSGAFVESVGVHTSNWMAGAQNTTETRNLVFDASKANPIYSASETVQPPAITLIAQIKY